MLRVCAHGAEIEIWTPYARSNEAFGYGHHVFLTEMHWQHICFEHDRMYLADGHGYFEWTATEYALVPGMLTELARTGISLAFALEHMFNIAPEWGVFLRVRKDAARAPGPQRPLRSFSFAGARGKRFPIGLSSRQLSLVDPSGDGLIKRVRRWVRTRTTKG